MRSPGAAKAQSADPLRFRRGVARGLTISFAVLALLPLGSGIIGVISTETVREPLQRVVAVTESFGTEDRAFRARSRGLVNLFFIQDDTFESRTSYDAAVIRVNDALAEMRGSIERIAANEYISRGDELRRRQEYTESAMREMLATTGRRVGAQERQQALVTEITAAAQRVADITSLASAEQSGRPANEVRRRLDSIRYSASTLSRLAREGGRLRQTNDLSPLRAEFAARMRAALNELVYLPEAPYRDQLGLELESIFDRSLANAGLFDTVDEALALRRIEGEQRESIRRFVTQTVEMLGGIARDNDANVAASLQNAETSLLRADLRMLLVGSISTLLALAVMIVFVRGNVLRRLAELTTVTKKLTHARLEEPVKAEGDDELAELASALETFRKQALQLRRKERELAARTEELEHVNQELDQFAYVASHDLKAPMRAIDSLAGFLREDLGDSADAASLRHLDMMQSRVRRLDSLLDSLLEYSRVGRNRAPPEFVDLRELIENSAEIVLPQGAKIRYSGSFGKVRTSTTPLEQVIRNLVDNAIKHNDAAHGEVSIDCEVVDGRARIAIADNGPGIAPEHHERVFGMFQTLKPRDEVEGSGMGLAILKKLVDTYGGSIAVESDPASKRGTCFIVEWPVRPEVAAAEIATGESGENTVQAAGEG